MTHSEIRELVRHRVGSVIIHQVRSPVQLFGGSKISMGLYIHSVNNIRSPVENRVARGVRWSIIRCIEDIHLYIEDIHI